MAFLKISFYLKTHFINCVKDVCLWIHVHKLFEMFIFFLLFCLVTEKIKNQLEAGKEEDLAKEIVSCEYMQWFMVL